MKKNFTLLALIMMALAVTFVSCTDDDEYEAYTLEGAWEGDMGVMINGYVADYSTIYFDKNPYQYASGEGYQVDWYPVGPYEELSFHFYWNIDNGIIHLDYPGYREDYNADIYNYSLNNDEFTGYFHIGGEEFRLFKLKDYYWEPY